MFKYKKEKARELRERIAKLPRVHLAHLPTPLQIAPRLSEELKGPLVYFKRDDLTGLALGGNKTRIFEFILGHAVKMGAEDLKRKGQRPYLARMANRVKERRASR